MTPRKKKKLRSWWVAVDKDGVLWGEALGSRADKIEEMKLFRDYRMKGKVKIIKVREVRI